MKYMEISLLSKTSLRIKGKRSVIAIDPQDKTTSNAAILLSMPRAKANTYDAETVIINGPGEYEIGGIKIKGTVSGNDVIYFLSVDGISILIGKIESLDKMQQKLQENNIVLALSDMVLPASFLTSLASNALIFYGEKAFEISQSFGKNDLKPIQKYITTLDKLPQEMEAVLLN
jgi:hypothetical protein